MADIPIEALHKITLRSNGKGSYLTPTGVIIFNALHESGMHYADIAKVVGITKSGAYNRIQDAAPSREYNATAQSILDKIQAGSKTTGGYLNVHGRRLFRAALNIPNMRTKDLAIIFGMTPSAVSHKKAELKLVEGAVVIKKPKDHKPTMEY